MTLTEDHAAPFAASPPSLPPEPAARSGPRGSPPMAADDATVIAQSLREPQAFAAIFDRHWPSIHAFCTARAGAAGEDLAAETFSVAFARRRRYDGAFPDARPWLYGIATNLLRDHFRGAARGSRAIERAAALDGTGRAPGADGPLARLEAQMLGPELAAALGALPDADRDALLLRAWAELGYDEIARALDVPIGTVRSRIHRARRRVRVHISEKDLNR